MNLETGIGFLRSSFIIPRSSFPFPVLGVCRTTARDPAKVEDQVRFLARTFRFAFGCFVSIFNGGVPCKTTTSTTNTFFEPMSKRRKGFPSETKVKRGVRIVNDGKLLEEKLGRNDLCPCGSGKQFKKCCLKSGCF
jgi:hypothetical protein